MLFRSTGAKGDHQKFGLMAQTRTNLRDTCDHISRSSCNVRRRVDERKPVVKINKTTGQSIIVRTEPQGTGHVWWGHVLIIGISSASLGEPYFVVTYQVQGSMQGAHGVEHFCLHVACGQVCRQGCLQMVVHSCSAEHEIGRAHV